MFEIKKILARARSKNKTIVFPEAGFSDRTIAAVKFLRKKKICNVILIGDESALALRDKSLVNFNIMNPKTSPLKDKLAAKLYSKRKEKGMTQVEAKKLILDPYYFAVMLLEADIADGMVAGAEGSTATVLRPALQLIKTPKKGDVASSTFIMFGKNKFLKDKTLYLSDCSLIPNPTAEQLVTIASQTIETAKLLCEEEMNVAFLSYSTKSSASGISVAKMAEAAKKFSYPAVVSDGELQLDAALRPEVCALKAPSSPIAGNANILIFPNLDSANIGYKSIQMFGGLNAIGPIVQGLKKPVNDVSRGCSVSDIILVSAITALQVKEKKK